MTRRVTPEQTRLWFVEHTKRRRDYGFGHAVLNLLFCPRNPFVVRQKRKLRAGFLFLAVWLGAGAALFVFFNFITEKP